MDSEKFNKVLEYFASEGIELPTDVRNSIEDVFLENDNIENVTCYFRDELMDFQVDLTLKNSIKIYTDGRSIGCTYNTFTYHGQVDFSLSESVNLLKRENNEDQLIEQITDIDNHDRSSMIYDKNEYNVVLVETLIWNTPEEPTRHSQLYIYCPDGVVEEENNGDDR